MPKKRRQPPSAQHTRDPGAHQPGGLSDSQYLQTQIDIIQGKRSARPSGDLRALEAQVLGPRSDRYALETQRWMHPSLDGTVLSASVVSQPCSGPQLAHGAQTTYATKTTPTLAALQSPFSAEYAAAITPSNHSGRGLCSPFSTVVADDTFTSGKVSSAHESHQQTVPQQAVSPEAPAPELLAPGQSRFEVEPFEQATSAVQPAVAMHSQSPITAPLEALLQTPVQPLEHETTRTAAPLAATEAAEATVREADDGNWISAAQAEQPKTITAASKKSLNSGLVLAKDDFERELAGILGTAPPMPNDQSSESAEFLEQAAQAQAQREPMQGGNGQSGNGQAVTSANNGAANNGAANTGSGIAQKPAEAADSETPAHPTHDVFDRMGLGLQYANSFDLGEVTLNNRFEAIEQSLDGQAPTQSVANAQAPDEGDISSAQANDFADPFVAPEDLDDFDLVAELAQIGGSALPTETTPTQAAPTHSGPKEAAPAQRSALSDQPQSHPDAWWQQDGGPVSVQWPEQETSAQEPDSQVPGPQKPGSQKPTQSIPDTHKPLVAQPPVCQTPSAPTAQPVSDRLTREQAVRQATQNNSAYCEPA